MLIKLTPEKVSEYWNWIAPIAIKSVPGYTEESDLTSLLRSLLIDDMSCYIICNLDRKFKGLILTSFEINKAFDFKSLVIYSFYVSSRFSVSIKELRDILDSLKDFAKDKGCKQILSYTNDKKLFNIARKLGATSDFLILKWEV